MVWAGGLSVGWQVSVQRTVGIRCCGWGNKKALEGILPLKASLVLRDKSGVDYKALTSVKHHHLHPYIHALSPPSSPGSPLPKHAGVRHRPILHPGTAGEDTKWQALEHPRLPTCSQASPLACDRVAGGARGIPVPRAEP
jgi:hypothetical protein